jgi:predicted nuclease with TOPRIM domain
MSKECPICKTETYTEANFCSVDGYKFLDKELTEEDKLRIKLIETDAANQGLNWAINEIKRISELLIVMEKSNADYKNKLDQTKQEKISCSKSLSQKETEINTLSKKLKTVPRRFVTGIIILSVVCVILGITTVILGGKNNVQSDTSASKEKISMLEKENNALRGTKNSLNGEIQTLKTENITLSERTKSLESKIKQFENYKFKPRIDEATPDKSLGDYLRSISDQAMSTSNRDNTSSKTISKYFENDNSLVIKLGNNNTEVDHTTIKDFLDELTLRPQTVKIEKAETNANLKITKLYIRLL